MPCQEWHVTEQSTAVRMRDMSTSPCTIDPKYVPRFVACHVLHCCMLHVIGKPAKCSLTELA